MMHKMHPTNDITAPNNINGYQHIVPVASSVVINDASIHRTGGIERGY
jgi:hypothetical protein